MFTKGASEECNDNSIPDFPAINELTVDVVDVRKKILELNVNKSTGPDCIPARLIRDYVDFFAPIITGIFKRSLREGVLPTILKTAHLIPLFKNRSKISPTNYRPVSITAIIAKIMESIVKDHIEKHIIEHNVMSSFQHGFCKGRSTATNMIEYWNDLSQQVDVASSISIIYTDLRKAFDSVPHDLLLVKLKRIGINGSLYRWIEEFLRDREQKVVIKGKMSSSVRVESGVPQGGVLSGLFFAIYINDLPLVFDSCKVSLYADDAKIYAPITSQASIQAVQKDINNMVEWCKKWRLNIHPDKCFHLQHNPRSVSKSWNPDYYIGAARISRKSEGKDLGITITEDLKFHKHINNVCQKANRETNRIRELLCVDLLIF